MCSWSVRVSNQAVPRVWKAMLPSSPQKQWERDSNFQSIGEELRKVTVYCQIFGFSCRDRFVISDNSEMSNCFAWSYFASPQRLGYEVCWEVNNDVQVECLKSSWLKGFQLWHLAMNPDFLGMPLNCLPHDVLGPNLLVSGMIESQCGVTVRGLD